MNRKRWKNVFYVLILALLTNVFFASTMEVEAAVSGVSLRANVTANTGAWQVIDPMLTLSGSGNLTGATVIIDSNFNSSTDSLSNGVVPGGLTANYNSQTGILSISGSADIAVYQDFLRTVTFKTTSNSGTRTVFLSVNTSSSNAVYNSPTQHFYEFVSAQGITWQAANTAAQGRNYNGMTGYLATVSTQAENDFIAARCLGSGWMGASDADEEGKWKWVTGPEDGTLFWNGDESGSAAGGQYSNWKSGDEPNDNEGEDYLHIMGTPKPSWASGYAVGHWNDFAGTLNNDINGYVVEYGNQTIGDSGVSTSSFSATTTITIQSKSLATVSTGGVTNNTTGNSATLSGNVTADGNDIVTERGICYSTSSNPTVSNMKVSSGSGTGSFNANLTGISEGTTYYYKAYAVNSVGTSYGNEASFTTVSKPTIVTNAATGVGPLTASLNGNVNSDGGSVITERGFYYNTTTNPKVGGTKVTVGGTTGTFSSSPSLNPGTRYYYIAYAMNAIGTSEGTEQSFITTLQNPVITLSPSIDSVTISWLPITNATSYDVYCDGSVINVTGNTYTHDSLIPNTLHNYKVIAKNSISQSVGDVAEAKYTLAKVPVITSADTKQNGSVILTIDRDNNSGSTQYYIEKSKSSDFSSSVTTVQAYATIGTSTITVPKHSTNESLGVLPARTYYFRVKAKNGDNVETIYNTTVLGSLTVPEIPVITTITPQFDPDGYGTKQLNIEWSSVLGADSYDIYDSTGTYLDTILSGTTSFTHKSNVSSSGGLIPNTQYSYKIVARNNGTTGNYDDGCSIYSNVLGDVTYATTPDVDEMKALANGNVSLKVEEKDNPGTTEYYIEKASNPEFTDAVMALNWTNPGNDNLLIISGLTRGTTYYFRVMARNSHNDETTWGEVIGNIRTIPADLSLAPNVSVISTTQINLSWTTVTGATSYDIYYSDGTFFKNVSGTTTSDTGLAPNTLRQYYIKGRSSSGVSLVQSPTSTAAYSLAAKPDLTLVPLANGDIRVELLNNGNTNTTQYYVEYALTTDFSGASSLAYSTDMLRTITGLQKGTNYYFRVKAKNGNNIETAYSTGKIVMTALERPSISQGTPFVDGTNHKVTIEWNSVTGAVNYKIYKEGNLLGTTSGTTFTDTNLKANKVYSYTVTAVNAAGESLPSDSYSVCTLAEYPEEMLASDKTINSFHLTVAPHSLVANSQKYRLIVKKASDQSLVRTLSWSSDLTYELNSLSPGVLYDVYVDVRNNDNLARGEKKVISLYCNRPVDAVITNDENKLLGDSDDGKFELHLKVWDPDADTITITATVAGLVRTVTIVAPTTEPTESNVTLTWDTNSLPENDYTNIVVSIEDGNDSNITRTFTHTLSVDKTPPVITIIGLLEQFIEVGEIYTDLGVIVTGDDNNGFSVSGEDIDTSVAGDHTITYSSSDAAGNVITKTRIVRVVVPVSKQSIVALVPEDGIGSNSAIIAADLSTLGKDQELAEHGFAYSTVSFTAIDEVGVSLINLGPKYDINRFISSISGLDADISYVVRAYVKKLDGTIILSEEESFITQQNAGKVSVYFKNQSYHTNEGDSITVIVERSGDLTVETQVDCNLTGGTATAGSDFTGLGTTLSFASGEATKTFVIPAIDDNEYELEETVIYTLQNVSSGAAIVYGTTTITITSNDPKILSNDNAVSSFHLAGYNASIDDTDPSTGKIILTVPYGTNLSNEIPELFTVPVGSVISPDITLARDFREPIAYTITAEDGSQRRYVVTVTVLPQSNVNTLDSISLETVDGVPQNLSPSFSEDTTEYEMNVESSVDVLQLGMIKTSSDSNVVVKVNGVIDDSPEALALVTGVNTIAVEVTAANGTKKTYTIVITRAPQGTDSNNNLVSIAITNGTLNPVFSQSIIDYTVNVPNSTSTMTVVPTLSNPNASFAIIANGQVVGSGVVIPLNVGANVIAVTVTATDGTAKTYAISVSRGAAATAGSGNNGVGGSNNGESGNGGNTGSTDNNTNNGSITKDKQQDSKAPATNLNNSNDDLKSNLFSSEELKQISAGEDAKVILKVVDISDSIKAEEKKLIADTLGKDTDVLYIDLSLYKKIGDGVETRITETKKKISISISVPEVLRNNDSKKIRTYQIVRIHNDQVEIINGSYDPLTNLFTFETDRFSTYALSFKDTGVDENTANTTGNTSADGGFNHLRLRAVAGATTHKLVYARVSNADGYIIYGAVCGIDNKLVKLADVSSKTQSYLHTGLKKGTYYKYLVKAYKIVDGKKVFLVASKMIHSTTTSKKYTNPQAVTTNITSTTLAVKTTKQITGKDVVVKGKKVDYHAAVVRYETTNKAVATVSSTGKITAKGRGNCYIYVYAQNGVYKKIQIIVK